MVQQRGSVPSNDGAGGGGVLVEAGQFMAAQRLEIIVEANSSRLNKS